MGKDYFEFLEEEFQGLTSQVQESLKQRQAASSSSTEERDIPLLFTRCHAIYQQLRSECHSTRNKNRKAEYKERLTLYSIQLKALLEYYQNSLFDNEDGDDSQETDAKKQEKQKVKEELKELTFTFTIDEEGTAL